jgi:PKD repeat protein
MVEAFMKSGVKWTGRMSAAVVLTGLCILFFGSCGGDVAPGGGGGGGSDPDPLSDPRADAVISPVTAFVGDTLSLDGSGSSDADGMVVDWEWDMGNGSSVSGETAQYTYTAAGDYTVTLTVTDNDGRTGSASVSVSISDGAPLVDIGGPYGPVTVDGSDNGNVNFSAAATAYGGAGIAGYQWSYGDGTSESGATLSAPSYQYTAPSAPDDYTVSLTVTDSFGRTGSDTATVRVHQAPVADAGANKSAVEGDTVNFDASASYDPDSDGGISGYDWDFDYDGVTFTMDASGQSVSYTYASVGTYTVALYVTDNDGAAAGDTVEVTVVASGSNLPPTADAGGPYDAVLVNTAASFDGSGSSDPDGSIALYEWDFDYDGVTFTVDDNTGPSVSNTYTSVGTYTVALRVSDDDASPETDIDTTVITVHAAPTADINDGGNPGWVVNGESFTLSASDSAPDGGAAGGPVDYIAEYRWDFDNDGITDSVTSVPTVSHSYSSDGDKTVALRVMDSNGEVSSNTETHTLTVHQAVTADIGGPYGAAGDNVFQIDEVITLDGSGSDDPDSVGTGTISSYTS